MRLNTRTATSVTAIVLLVTATLAAHAAPPPARSLADALRRADRGDHSGALERLGAVERASLDETSQALHDRIAADAHIAAAIDKSTTDPGFHLTAGFDAHLRCVAAASKTHRKHCAGEAKLVRRAVADRATRLAQALELGGAVSSVEIADRCTQLRTLEPDGPGPARCLARLAWSSTDADRAREAFAWALPLPPSETRDVTLAQAAATLLHGLGDAPGAAELLAQVSEPGAQVAAMKTSLTVFEQKLLPRQQAALSTDSPESWRAWLNAATDAKLFVLAVNDAERATLAHPRDAKLLQTAASVRTKAAASVPSGGDTQGRNRRILELLRAAHRDLSTCADLPDAPPQCAQLAARVQAQCDQLSERLP